MKAMVAVLKKDIAPRFDLTLEAVFVDIKAGKVKGEPRTILISRPSGEDLSALAVKEGVDVVVCGGIDEVHYDFLVWKEIRVIDGVIGPFDEALEVLAAGSLEPNAILAGAKAD